MKYTASQQRPEAGTVPVSPRPVSQLGAVPGRHPGQSRPQPGKSKSIVKVNYDLCPKHELRIDHCRSPHCTQHIYNYTHSRELRNASVGANTPIYTSLEGGDKWVMSKFRQTTILRPFFDIFERLPKTQNFFFWKITPLHCKNRFWKSKGGGLWMLKKKILQIKFLSKPCYGIRSHDSKMV